MSFLAQLYEAQKQARAMAVLIDRAIAQITGNHASTRATRPKAVGPARVLPAGNGKGAGNVQPAREQIRGTDQVLGQIAKRGPMTREQIIELTGWSQGAANLQLGRATKSGKLALADGRYSLPSATTSETQQAA